MSYKTSDSAFEKLCEIKGEEYEKPSLTQVGGTHYKDMAIQVSEFVHRNKIPWLEANAIKYICRHTRKHGGEDVDKAIHYLQLLKEWDYGKEETSTQDTK